MTIRLLIADPDSGFVGILREALLGRREFQITGMVQNGEEALRIAERTRPDLLLLSAFLPGMDGITLVREVCRLPHPPVCIMCTCYLPDVLTDAILRSGVFYLLYKPQTPERILQVLLKCAELNRISARDAPEGVDCTSLLRSIGISGRLSGYRYLERAIPLCIENPERVRNLSGWLYREVGQEFDTKPEQVERAIRLCIRSAYAAGSMKGVFRTRPGNREFLLYLIRRIKENA